MSVLVSRFNNYPIPSNCYLVKDSTSGHFLIVDPGTEDMSVILANENESLIDNIILTHEHFDHCWGCNYLHDKFEIPIICSDYCAESIPYRKKNLSIFYNQVGFDVRNQVNVIEKYREEVIWFGNKIIFWRTEGHSIGGICFLIDDYLFTGDTLLENSPTITKLINGSKKKLVDSISIFETLKGNRYKVCPGHGDIFDLDSYDLNKALK